MNRTAYESRWVELPDGAPWEVTSLLGDGRSNAKLSKSDDVSDEWLSYGLSLAPADESGYQMCPNSSPGCRECCLHFQGRSVVWPGIKKSRVGKTIAFHRHRRWFKERLRFELSRARNKARKARKRLCVRPNVLSDLPWEKIWPWMFDDFHDATWYDYTKNVNRALAYCAGKMPNNYHLTFSRSELNDKDCLRVLEAGGNVAVVFAGPIPDAWRGYSVFAGDETDLRFLDPKNVVVGLTAKGTAKKDRTGFVLRLNEHKGT